MPSLAYDYFKTRYETELRVQSEFFPKCLAMLLTYGCLLGFAAIFSVDVSCLNWSLVPLSLGVICVCVSCWYTFMLIFKCGMQHMPEPANIKVLKEKCDSYAKEMKQYNEEYGTNYQSDIFEKYLIDDLAHCASVNRKVNADRSRSVYRALLLVKLAAMFFLFAALIKATHGSFV